MGFIYSSPPSQVALRDSKTSPRPASARVSWCLEISSIKTPFPDGSLSLALLSLFLYFVLSPFEDNGLRYWAPDDLS